MEKLDLAEALPLELETLRVVTLTSHADWAQKIANALTAIGLKKLEHADSLQNLENLLRKGSIDLVVSDIHADDDSGLLLPSLLLSTRKEAGVGPLPRILWLTDEISELTEVPYHRNHLARQPDTANSTLLSRGCRQGISIQALQTHARLARSLGLTIGIARLDQVQELSEILYSLIHTQAQSFPPIFSYEELPLEDDLIVAITTGEGLRIVLQPQYDLRTKEIIGAEALARWTHPEHGAIAPAIFIPMVNRLDLNLMLFSFVKSRVIEIQTELFARGIHLPIAINASAKTMCSRGLARHLAEKMKIAGLPLNLLKIELTEELPVEDSLLLSASLNSLRRLGFQTSLDDFGSGFAKINLLATMPFDEVKIDGSFVREIDQKPSRSIIETVSALASLLNMRLIAEGIEDESSIATLRRLGCQQGQGYALSRPLETKGFLRLCLAWKIPA